MKGYELDLCFQLAAIGDENAFKKLYEYYIRISRSEVQQYIKKNKLYGLNVYDYEDVLTELFFSIVKTFNPKKVHFSYYIKLVIGRRMAEIVKKSSFNVDFNKISLDESDEDKSLYDVIEDKSIVPLPDSVSIDRFKYEISSVRGKNNSTNRLRAKINMMLLAGYTKEEIRLKFHLTRSQMRTLDNINKNDRGLQNLKLELK